MLERFGDSFARISNIVSIFKSNIKVKFIHFYIVKENEHFQMREIRSFTVTFTENLLCTIKFFPIVYLENHVEILSFAKYPHCQFCNKIPAKFVSAEQSAASMQMYLYFLQL